MKRLKQKVAAGLIVAMAATNVLSAAAATIGTPSPDRTSITLTFNAGGGYWNVASDSDASPSTTSNSTKETQADGRTDTLKKTFRELISDREGKFITLHDAADQMDPEWDAVNAPEGLEKAGWYYVNGDETTLVGDLTAIYSDVTLTAKWHDPSAVKDEADSGLKAVDLPDGAEVTVKTADKIPAAELAETAVAELAQVGVEIDGEAVYGLDIDVSNAKGEAVTISLPVPDVLDEEKPIKAIHLKDEDTVEVLDVNVTQAGKDDFWMTFTSKSFSPFYFVNTKEVLTTAVTVENVESGYLIVYSGDNNDRTYFPIGEEVTLPAETEIHIGSRAFYYNGYNTELESVVADYGSYTEEVPLESYGVVDYTLKAGTCTLRAKFATEESKPYSPRALFSIQREPFALRKDGIYEGTISVRKLDPETGSYKKFEGWRLEVATQEELQAAGLSSSMVAMYTKDSGKFSFDPATNILTSKEALNASDRYYYIPFVIICEETITENGQEKQEEVRYVAYNNSSNPEAVNLAGYYTFINVGVDMYYYIGLVMRDGEYDPSVSLGNEHFSYEDGMTWEDLHAEEIVKKQNYFAGGEPKLHNYKFAGWQDFAGENYLAETPIEGSAKPSPYRTSFSAYARFTDDENKVYNGVKAILDEDLSTNNGGGDDDNQGGNQGGNDDNQGGNQGGNGGNQGGNQGGNNGNQGSGSSSGGGSRYGGGGSASAAKDYTMHGNWMAAENGWRFLKDSGEYATNTWGYINGLWYYFDAQGNMVTGWYYVNGQWYYMNPAAGSVQGAMMTGWVLDPTYNAWFYLTGSGAMATGWQQINGLWYYLNPVSDGTKGVMAANTYVDGYFVNADGVWVQ